MIVNEKDIKTITSSDDVIYSIYNTYGKPVNYFRPQGFETLSRIILEQQVSLTSAKAHYLKFKSYIVDFEPNKVLILSDEEFKMCQISRQKMTYLRALATAILDKSLDLEKLDQLSNEEVIFNLTKIKGIGLWTANVYLMFCLQRKTIFPIGDVAIRSAIKELYNIYDKEDMIKLSESWSPLQSLASYFLWHYYLKSRNRPAIF